MYQNVKKKKKRKKEKKQSQKGKGGDGRERKLSEKEREKEKRGVEREKLISKIYENLTIGFSRSKRKSQSTHRELRMGTKILEFRQTPRGREFFYSGNF